MIFNFTDFLDLRNKTCEDDLTLFDEIITCIENEAYRSASILIWVTVLESLVRKLNVLALNDDEIRTFMENFENNKNEKDLLLKCKNQNLINQIEYGQLDTIREARNNYAHATSDSPSKEDVMIYMHYAVEYVLSKPNLFSKNSAKRELHKLLNDSNFLGNADKEQVEEYALTFTKKIANNYLDEIIKKLSKMIEKKFKEKDPNNNTCIKHGLIYAEILILNNLDYLTPDNSNYLIDEYRITSCHLFTNPHIWKSLDSRSKERIYNYSTISDSSQISSIDFLSIFHKLYNADKLGDSLKIKYEEEIDKASLNTLMLSRIPPNLYYDKLIEELESHNYYRQNPAAIIIRNRDLSVFSDNQLEQLGRNILQSAEGGANDSESTIRKFERNGNAPKSFLKGLLFETMINDDNELRVKPNYFENVMNIVNESQYKNEIFNEFIETIKQARPKSLDFNNYEIIIKRLKRFNICKSQFNLLINATKESIKNSANKYVERLLDVKFTRKFKLHLYECLTEENREKFIRLFYETPIEFVKFFNTSEIDNPVKSKDIEINMELIEKFIGYDTLKTEIYKLDYDSLNSLDKKIVDYFRDDN